MERLALIGRLVELLLQDMPEYRDQAASFPHEAVSQRRLLRSLMNVRAPGAPLPEEYWRLQDELLSAERDEKGVVDAVALPSVQADPRLSVWQGDITRLAADAIVNAANSALLGCFVPCHGCIDNAIHSAAGLQLREDCARIMRAQGREEPNGRAKITRGYNLPARYVLHTVGPIVQSRVTARNRADLAACYRSCLELAASRGLRTVAFCCISTGEFRFPNQEAADIAVRTVRAFLDQRHAPENADAGEKTVAPGCGGGSRGFGAADGMRVVFNVFKDEDLRIYRGLLGPDARC